MTISLCVIKADWGGNYFLIIFIVMHYVSLIQRKGCLITVRGGIFRLHLKKFHIIVTKTPEEARARQQPAEPFIQPEARSWPSSAPKPLCPECGGARARVGCVSTQYSVMWPSVIRIVSLSQLLIARVHVQYIVKCIFDTHQDVE